MENQKPNNPKAFPNDGNIEDGMTLRDYFANSAMQAVLTNEVLRNVIDENTNSEKDMYDWIAKGAYSVADAMLKQREL